MKNISDKGWFPNLNNAISEGLIPGFGTQKTALEKSIEYGWGRKIVKIERRFEYIYLVGVLDWLPETVADNIEHDVLRVPLLRWDTGDDGIKYQPVVKFRRISQYKEDK